jgi:phospholipid/cholesterol/gamma-HCH transport system substrate-binding protein
MDERVMQFRVGVMFLATLLITAILLVMFGKLPRMMGHYVLYVRFDYAGGVTKDTPVRKSGILIGRVSDVQLTDHDARVLVTLEIYSNKKIYKNEDCYISRGQLGIGETSLEFVAVPGNPGTDEVVAAGTTLEGKVSDDPTGLKRALEAPINTVDQTGKALTEAADALKVTARKVDDLIDTERKDLHDVLANAADSLQGVRLILGDKQTQARLADAMKKLPDTLDTMNQAFKSANDGFQKFTAPSGPDGKSGVDRMLATIDMTEQTLRKFSKGEAGKEAPADQIAKAMSDISEITGLMKSVIGRLDSGQGSIGALMNDRQLYDRLNRAARNIDEVSERLKPIVDDARVITDKMARHPGVIIRDAIKPGVGIK